MIEDQESQRQMELIKQGLMRVPKWELVKILMYFYFISPTGILDALEIWKTGSSKIGDVIKKYL